MPLSKMTLRVPIDYDASFDVMVSGCNCDEVFVDITEPNFPRQQTSGKVEREITLVCFNEILSSDEMREKLDEEGLQPGQNDDLLAVVATQLAIDNNAIILQIGQTWNHACGCRYVTMFYVKKLIRKLWIDWDESDWAPNCWVVAVPKVAS
ncbi:MAG: hypothetical protein WCV85_06255 [Patescibacteria group bacterium]|jgi:hypothetical protein